MERRHIWRFGSGKLEKNPQDLTKSKWYLTQEKSGNVGIKNIAKEIEGRSAFLLEMFRAFSPIW
jgi:hypothetical protein